ncbi:MAG: hypothetical protein Q7J38_02015 [Gallionella sp.]|nr:hypothetical protein [Gallionella sp.]
MTIATARAPAACKQTPIKKRLADTEKMHLASLSPWVRKLHTLAKPLTGKLTKAIEQQ